MRVQNFVLSLVLAAAGAATAFGQDLEQVMQRAQQALDQGNYSAAIGVLEPELPRIQGNQPVLLLLRSAYRGEVRRLVDSGDRTTAQKYLDRLNLLEKLPPDHETRTQHSAAPAGRDGVKVVVADPSLLPRVASQQSVWRPVGQSPALEAAGAASAAVSAPSVRVLAARPSQAPRTVPFVVPADPAQPSLWVKQADALFVAGRYVEAGELYDRANAAAPESIREANDRWTYCRLARIVNDINSTQRTSEQWSRVEQETLSLLEKLPHSKFTQSLSAIVGTREDGTKLASASNSAVVRASEPDRLDPKESNLLAGLAARIGLGSSKQSTHRSLWRRFRNGNWQVIETSNFRVHASDDSFAGQIADTAECSRIELYRTWYGIAPQSNWNPKCDIYVHNSADQYAQVTHQGPGSPGHSQTGIQRGQITSRRVDLRRDGPDLQYAVLPHEITHVVLADRFTSQPMPRWADEGMAVLTEPTEKKQAHLRNLGDYLQRGKIFPARQLMTMADYPSGPNWPVFYAESVSLVDFLVARGGPTTFIEFMQRSLRNGYEPELKRTYSLNGFDELDRAWTAHRVQQIAAARGTATAQAR